MAEWCSIEIYFTKELIPSQEQVDSICLELHDMDYDFPKLSISCGVCESEGYRSPLLEISEILRVFDEKGFPCRGWLEITPCEDEMVGFCPHWTYSERCNADSFRKLIPQETKETLL